MEKEKSRSLDIFKPLIIFKKTLLWWKMKPEYVIENWSVVNVYGDGKRLMGDIQNHPRCTPGRLHATSLIVRWLSENKVETRNSIYHLGKIGDWYKQFMEITERDKNKNDASGRSTGKIAERRISGGDIKADATEGARHPFL